MKEELEAIKGVGPEFAKRVMKIYKTRENLKKAKDLEDYLPDHVAKKIKRYVK